MRKLIVSTYASPDGSFALTFRSHEPCLTGLITLKSITKEDDLPPHLG